MKAEYGKNRLEIVKEIEMYKIELEKFKSVCQINLPYLVKKQSDQMKTLLVQSQGKSKSTQESMQNELNDQAQYLNQLLTINDGYCKDIASISNQNANQKSKISNLEKQLKECKDQLTETKSELAESIQKQREDRAAYENRVCDRPSCISLSQQLQNMDTVSKQKEADFQREMEENISKLQKELRIDYKQKLADILQKVQSKQIETKKMNMTKDNEIEDLQNQVKKLQLNLKDLKHERNQIEINGVQYQKLQNDKSRVEDENKQL